MGILLLQILVFSCGILAIIFSILAWRLKNDVYFFIGAGATLIILIYQGYNYEFLWDQMVSGNVLFILFNVGISGVPIFFLISSKLHASNASFDNIEEGGPVTEEYLDEIINAPDEEINFEDDLDLK